MIQGIQVRFSGMEGRVYGDELFSAEQLSGTRLPGHRLAQ